MVTQQGLFSEDALDTLLDHDDDGALQDPPKRPAWLGKPLFAERAEPSALAIRGLHLDLARHFIEVPTILRIIETMAALKLNTLHLHLSDDQGFPVEFEAFPHIQPAQRLTVADQETIAQACAQRGIQVIPELDIPGHVRAFLSYFDPKVTLERRMGLITTEYIELERDLPVILQMFEELVARFGSKVIHMGGDEAKNYARFPELIERVCAWAAERGLEVMAWDDVLGPLDVEKLPSNLIIQRWRFRASPKVQRARVVLSWGYYLDHVDDPFTIYNRAPHMWGEPLGCIACMWTELVTDRTVERTVFPSLYMAAHRWWTFPEKQTALPVLLKQLCDELGYPPEDMDTWRTRRWVGFYKDDPRSTSSVTLDDVLDRDQDLYPVFSRSLVVLADALYRAIQWGEAPSDEAREILARFGQEAYGEDLGFVWERKRNWKKRLSQILGKAPTSLYHNDGLAVALRRALKP